MFAKTKNETVASSSNSSVDWECDGGSQSWASTASWSDDVETEATARLLQQMQDVESVLFGEASPKTLPPALRQEVAQWRATFPHFRVCGTKAPIGPRPSEPEEGQEEVYASHGEYEEVSDNVYGLHEDSEPQEHCQGEDCSPKPSPQPQDSDTKHSNRNSASEQIELKEKLKREVLNRLFQKLHLDVASQLQPKAVKKIDAPPVSASRHREPLLASRQSARKEINRRIQHTPQDAELGTLLRVSPLPRRQILNPGARAATVSSRGSISLPPIDVQPEQSRNSGLSLSVHGRQTRLIQQRSKIHR